MSRFPHKKRPRWVARSKISFSIEIFNLDRNFQSRSKSRIFLIFGPSGHFCVVCGAGVTSALLREKQGNWTPTHLHRPRSKLPDTWDLVLCKWAAAFFAYSWRLPAYSGAFLPTVDNFSFFACSWSSFAYSFSFSTYSWSFCDYSGKVRLIRPLRDCKQRSLTVSKKAPTVSRKASPLCKWAAGKLECKLSQSNRPPTRLGRLPSRTGERTMGAEKNKRRKKHIDR